MSNILHIDRNTGAITVDQLTASRLLSTDGSKALVSSDLASWVTGTSNRVTVTDGGNGTITLSGPQDIHTGAAPTFAGLTVDAGASPGTLLTVQSTGETANSIIDFQCEKYLLCNYTVARTSAAATQFTVRRSRGTLASPSAVANEDEIGSFVFQGHDGSSYVNVCGIATKISGTVGEDSIPGNLYFYTNPGASTYRIVGKFDTTGLFVTNYGIKDQTLTASRLVVSNADQQLVSSDLASWVSGTSNQITVTDDGDGTITLSALLYTDTGDPYLTTLGYQAGSNTTGDYCTFIGYQAGKECTSGMSNIGLGTYACGGLSAVEFTGIGNLAIGTSSGQKLTTANYNVFVGVSAGKSSTTGGSNVAIGYNAHRLAITTTGCVKIGNQAGTYDTNSNRFIIDNQDRSSAANELTKALMYGVFDADPANQSLRINGEILGSVGAKIGDGGTTNYVEIKSDGEVNLHGTARVKQGIWVDANGIKAPGAKPATEISHGDLEASDRNFAWRFGNSRVAVC